MCVSDRGRRPGAGDSEDSHAMRREVAGRTGGSPVYAGHGGRPAAVIEAGGVEASEKIPHGTYWNILYIAGLAAYYGCP